VSRAELVSEIEGLRMLADFSQDLEDEAQARRVRRKLRALKAQLRALDGGK
jgi:hypothetical protein